MAAPYRAAGQMSEAIAQIRSHLLNPKHGGASGGEFNRQRYAVEMPADRANRLERPGVQAEFRVQRTCAGNEKFDRTAALDMSGFFFVGGGHFQRRERYTHSPPMAKGSRLVARNRRARAQAYQRLDKVCRRVDDMLAIV